MSTNYIIFKKDGSSLELAEHSNKLDLDLYSDDYHSCFSDLTPGEVTMVGLEMLKIASYWCDEDVFLNYIKIYLEKEGGKFLYMVDLLNKISTEGNRQDAQN